MTRINKALNKNNARKTSIKHNTDTNSTIKTMKKNKNVNTGDFVYNG